MPPLPPPLYARLCRLDRPPGRRFTALFHDPALTRHAWTEFRECAEGERLIDPAGVVHAVRWSHPPPTR